MGNSTELGLLIRKSKEKFIPICERGWHTSGWKKTKPRSYVEETDEIG